MRGLEHLSRKAIVGWWLFLSLAPFVWVLFIGENRWQWLNLVPILPGAAVMILNHSFSYGSGGISVILAAMFSLLMAAGALFLMFRLPRWRLLVVAVVFSGYCFFRALTEMM